MKYFLSIFTLLWFGNVFAQTDSTYAEKLGFPGGAKVVIMHVDDVGMSLESNQGAIETMTKGVASSCSIMMTCPWVPGYFHYLKDHPQTDAGLHLTLTSEWKDYRWGPLSSKKDVPGLVDPEGAMWSSVEEVVKHSNADEVEMEMRAQIDRALSFGFKPTHFDSHMGTLFASQAFLQRYFKMGIEYQTPIMFPGGHNTLIAKVVASMGIKMEEARAAGKMLWDAGLPVIDDLHNESYALHLPPGMKPTTENLRKYKTEFYINALRSVKPGITYVIMHCSKVTPNFAAITNSSAIREGDYEAMLSPELKTFIQKEGIIVTTMRDLMERRTKRR